MSWLRKVTAIRSDRRFRFDLTQAEVWAQITDVERYRTWWPWLRELHADGFAQGEVWRCRVQPPAPYSVRFKVSLDEVVERERVAATITGDIEGSARLQVARREGGAEIHLVSDLAPRHPGLRALALMGKPFLRFGHDWVLDSGARDFDRKAVQDERRRGR